MPKFRITKEIRYCHIRGKSYYYIQKKWLFWWFDVIPFNIDAEFYAVGYKWETFEEAHNILMRIYDILNIQKKKKEVVWTSK